MTATMMTGTSDRRFAESGASSAPAQCGDHRITHQQLETAMTPKEREAKALAMREQALGLLQMAQAIDGRRPYLVTHTHECGSSGYVIWHTHAPTEKQAAALLDAQFEPDRNESLTIEDNLTLRELTGGDSSHVVGSRTRKPCEMPA
jgi:hypothetical protein